MRLDWGDAMVRAILKQRIPDRGLITERKGRSDVWDMHCYVDESYVFREECR